MGPGPGMHSVDLGGLARVPISCSCLCDLWGGPQMAFSYASDTGENSHRCSQISTWISFPDSLGALIPLKFCYAQVLCTGALVVPTYCRSELWEWGSHSAVSLSLLCVSAWFLSRLLCRSCSVSPQFFFKGNSSVGVNSMCLVEDVSSRSSYCTISDSKSLPSRNFQSKAQF